MAGQTLSLAEMDLVGIRCTTKYERRSLGMSGQVAGGGMAGITGRNTRHRGGMGRIIRISGRMTVIQAIDDTILIIMMDTTDGGGSHRGTNSQRAVAGHTGYRGVRRGSTSAHGGITVYTKVGSTGLGGIGSTAGVVMADRTSSRMNGGYDVLRTITVARLTFRAPAK